MLRPLRHVDCLAWIAIIAAACFGCAPECPVGRCAIDGICYPSGSQTEDGCCTCGLGGARCVPAARCSEPSPIGSRCEPGQDCPPGLSCQAVAATDRFICTRACNFGCPAETECVEGPLSQAGTPGVQQCMRPCASHDDCAGFGSECVDVEAAGGSYCL